MTAPLDRLRKTTGRLERHDAERARIMAERDAQIAAALAGGATWSQVQEASGLNPSAVRKALERHRAAQP
ncbi:hypothetical protein [Agromyces sp. NPDC058064]|uniref:hypothetical protein n=1 Tax=Agromyces sp. NPDC058064 TaxID=3346322 RepID=UPI0036DF0871